MKKLLIAFCSLMLITGCTSSNTDNEPTPTPTEEVVVTDLTGLKVIAPSGAPGLALMPLMKAGDNDINIVSGPDALQAELVTPNSEYDVVVAPTNLGVKLASAGKTDYRLLAIVSWGNLYIVGDADDALEKEGKFAAFGEEAVSGLVLKYIFNEKYESHITPVITWYTSVQEAQQILLSDNANVALLAEPLATATIAKAKEAGKEFKIIYDLQSEFGEDGYPQAGLFVKEEDYANNKARYDALVELLATNNSLTSQDEETITAQVDAIDVETLGVPSSSIVAKTWDRLNINVVKANQYQDVLSEFLGLFGIESIEGTVLE